MQAGDNQEGCEQTQISKAIAHERVDTSFPVLPALTTPSTDSRIRSGIATQPLFQLGPGLVGIESGHLCCHIDGIFPQVLFEDHSVLVDDEGLNTRIAVLRRIRKKAEPAGHFSIDKIRLGATLRIRTLIFQLPEVITIEGLGFIRLDRGFLVRCERNVWSERATRGALCRLPIQSVLLAGIANELLRNQL